MLLPRSGEAMKMTRPISGRCQQKPQSLPGGLVVAAESDPNGSGAELVAKERGRSL